MVDAGACAGHESPPEHVEGGRWCWLTHQRALAARHLGLRVHLLRKRGEAAPEGRYLAAVGIIEGVGVPHADPSCTNLRSKRNLQLQRPWVIVPQLKVHSVRPHPPKPRGARPVVPLLPSYHAVLLQSNGGEARQVLTCFGCIPPRHGLHSTEAWVVSNTHPTEAWVVSNTQ